MKAKYLASVLAAAFMLPAAAHAQTAYTADSLTMRAGPGRDYPRIERLSRNSRVFIHGCVDRFDWCDVSRGRLRGWVDGDALMIPYEGRRLRVLEYGPRLDVPVISFRFDNYWNDNYRRHSFYRDRDRWREYRSARRDQDFDGVPNRVDRDRDGDGVPNRWDDRPRNPYRD
jgi:uncharacterized protein YraI